MKRYVIVGNGVAGARAAIKIKETDPNGEIHIFTEESYPFYYRVRFPELIAGDIAIKDLTIHTEEYYRSKGITLHLEERVTGGDAGRREVVTEKGATYPYDLLLVATGGYAFVPPIKGVEKKGVFTLRSMRDAISLREFSSTISQAILIGGGLVGLETAGALLRRGVKIAVIEHNPRLLPRQTDPGAAKILQEKMERMGFIFYLNAQSEEIVGREKVEGLRLKDGRTVEGQMVILSAGVRSNLQLAKAMGLDAKNGVIVNDRLETNQPGIFAAGDVVEHRGRCYGIWPAAQKQGEVAGVNMAGGKTVYEGSVVSNKLKVVGVDLAAIGEIDAEGKFECIVRADREKGVYRKVAFQEDKMIGCLFLGDIQGSTEVQNAIERKLPVKEFREAMLKGDFDFKKLK
jgi:nitrite reductase (NADH) large subunit